MCKSNKVLFLRMEVIEPSSQANQAEKASRGKSLGIPERRQKEQPTSPHRQMGTYASLTWDKNRYGDKHI